MCDDGRKKISFGFSKKSSTPTLNKPLVNVRESSEKIEFIESLEGKEFKTLGPKEEEKKELVIPLKASIPKWQQKLLRQRAEKEQKAESGEKKESLEDLAVQELIKDAETAMQEKDEERKIHTIPLAEDEAEEDKEEPTPDNYASVPVADFGLAMLRGMGWTPGKGIGKNPKVVQTRELNIRPRGMGLGAERPNQSTTKKGQEDLMLAKGANVKIIQGALKGCYAKVESFDDSCGRVVVRMALGAQAQNVCEYMLEVVTSKEYKENSKKITTENAALVKRSTAAVGKSSEIRNGDDQTSKAYGLVKKHRSRSPVFRK